jgi:D-alanyl-D-alanine carboxypeptidase (penicillin-binding protein 5/6)
MNDAARSLGLRRTRYSTPIGLDTPGNWSCATDLARLAEALLRNRFFDTVVDSARATLADGRVMVNTNDLVGRYPFVIGVKTGHTTDAGYCLVGAGRLNGATVISVVLGDPSEATRDADTLALLRYGLALYHAITPVRAGAVLTDLNVAGSAVPLVAQHGATLVVRRGSIVSVYLEGVPSPLPAAVPSGTPEGFVDVRVDGRLDASVPLVTGASS